MKIIEWDSIHDTGTGDDLKVITGDLGINHKKKWMG